MKPFRLIWDNKSLYLGKTRMIGIKLVKNQIPGKVGIQNTIVIYYWKWWRRFDWVNPKF